MLARAVKHIVFEALRDRADLRAAPAPTLIACLNAALGNLQADHPESPGSSLGSSISSSSSSTLSNSGNSLSAPGSVKSPPAASSSSAPQGSTGGQHHPPHHSGAPGGAGSSASTPSSTKSGGKKGKSRPRKGGNHHAHGGSSQTQPQRTLGPAPVLELSLEEIREQIVADIRRRYRYAFHFPEGPDAVVLNPNTVLRRICQKLGLRVYSRAYDFTAREPLGVRDLVDVTPVAKHCVPAVLLPEAKEMLDNGRLLVQSGNASVAFD